MCSIFVLFFCFVFSIAESAIIRIDQVEISGHEGKCYDKDAKLFYGKGEIIKNEETECLQRTCLGHFEETGKVRIEVLTCPAVEAGPECIVVQDQSRPYPDCCPQLVSRPSVQPQFCESPQRQQK